jgi:glycosyltransferase involved in cell wall biosynthesis
VKVLYLSYTGLLEPLGQSQVLAYVLRLARQHEITLVSFEKPADLEDAGALAGMREACGAAGIRWIARRYHHRPRALATARDLADLTLSAYRGARGGADLAHARGYVPAFAALALKRLTGLPFIFDMRAFWPEEMVTAGRLRQGSPMFSLLKAGERACLREAAAVVSLTEAAVAHLKERNGGEFRGARYAVVPTCVDLDRFMPAAEVETGARPLRIGSVGTVRSGWFRMDWLVGFIAAAAEILPDARFEIVTRDDPAWVAAEMQAARLPAGRLDIAARAPAEVAGAMARLDAAAMFFEPGIAKLASCPTRMGEALACGVPVIANAGVGDVAEIIRRFGLGVLAADPSPAAMRRAVGELVELRRDPHLAARCRGAAEEFFSLDKGVAAYNALYEDLGALGRRRGARLANAT